MLRFVFSISMFISLIPVCVFAQAEEDVTNFRKNAVELVERFYSGLPQFCMDKEYKRSFIQNNIDKNAKFKPDFSTDEPEQYLDINQYIQVFLYAYRSDIKKEEIKFVRNKFDYSQLYPTTNNRGYNLIVYFINSIKTSKVSLQKEVAFYCTFPDKSNPDYILISQIEPKEKEVIGISMTVRAERGNAEIWINNERKGVGRWTGQLGEGKYLFESRIPGYREGKKSVDLKVGGIREVIIPAPIPIYGSLNITSIPHNATVQIDGKVVGYTPYVINEVLIGEKNVTISKEGCATSTQIVVVEEGKVKDLNVSLSQGKMINFKMEVSGEVYIDGALCIGNDTCSKLLPYGKHTVNISKEGGIVSEEFMVTESSPSAYFVQNKIYLESMIDYKNCPKDGTKQVIIVDDIAYVLFTEEKREYIGATRYNDGHRDWHCGTTRIKNRVVGLCKYEFQTSTWSKYPVYMYEYSTEKYEYQRGDGIKKDININLSLSANGQHLCINEKTVNSFSLDLSCLRSIGVTPPKNGKRIFPSLSSDKETQSEIVVNKASFINYNMNLAYKYYYGVGGVKDEKKALELALEAHKKMDMSSFSEVKEYNYKFGSYFYPFPFKKVCMNGRWGVVLNEQKSSMCEMLIPCLFQENEIKFIENGSGGISGEYSCKAGKFRTKMSFNRNDKQGSILKACSLK